MTWDVGPGQLYFDWSFGDEGKGSAVTAACSTQAHAHARASAALRVVRDIQSNQYEVSYTYPLSKRTSVYAGYNKIANDAQASYNFGVNSYQIATGGRPQGIVFGAWHNF